MARLNFFFLLLAGLCLSSQLTQRVSANPVTGVYRITPRVQPGMALDMVGYGNGDNTNVQIWQANHTSNQQWLVEAQTDGTYKIYAYAGQNSMQMLDDNNGGIGPGNNVTSYTDTNGPNQRWYFVSVGDGYYRIIPSAAGPNGSVTLDVRGGNSAGAGATLDIYTYGGGYNQQFRLDWSGPSVVLPNAKKGIAVGSGERKIPYVHGSWYYNWGGGEPGDMPTGVEFVPMVWGYYGGDATGYTASILAQPNVHAVLGFNEPDNTSGQADLTLAQCIQGFQGISNNARAGIEIGSPACTNDLDSYMQSFMQAASADNYHIDFVAVHCYIENPYQFENAIQQIYYAYGKPVWVTEFAPTDWASPSAVTVAQVENFMSIVIPWLNSQWYVQRYAWYSGAAPGGNWTLSSAGMINSDGTLSDVGRLYARM